MSIIKYSSQPFWDVILKKTICFLSRKFSLAGCLTKEEKCMTTTYKYSKVQWHTKSEGHDCIYPIVLIGSQRFSEELRTRQPVVQRTQPSDRIVACNNDVASFRLRVKAKIASFSCSFIDGCVLHHHRINNNNNNTIIHHQNNPSPRREESKWKVDLQLELGKNRTLSHHGSTCCCCGRSIK